MCKEGGIEGSGMVEDVEREEGTGVVAAERGATGTALGAGSEGRGDE